MDEKEPKLTRQEIVEFRANQRESDHWRWLWKLLKRWALWTAGGLTGAHALYVALVDFAKWWHQK